MAKVDFAGFFRWKYIKLQFQWYYTHLSKFLSRLTLMLTILQVLWLIRSELYCFDIRIQKIVLYYIYRLRANYMQVNNLTIKKTIKAKLSWFVIYLETIIYLINFVVLAVFINCSSSWQNHYLGHTCYFCGKI